jgi:hypothetical protein
MSGIFQNMDPGPAPSPPGEFVPPPPPPHLWCGGRTLSLGGEGMLGGSIFFKTPDTALYSTYVSTLCTAFHLKLVFSLPAGGKRGVSRRRME